MDIVERLSEQIIAPVFGVKPSVFEERIISERKDAVTEIERLREALRKIANGYSDEDGMRNIARQALGEKG